MHVIGDAVLETTLFLTEMMIMIRWRKPLGSPRRRRHRGVVTLEYLVLLTVVGIGSIVGLALVRNALVTELNDVATAITQLNNPAYVQPTHPTCGIVFTNPSGDGG